MFCITVFSSCQDTTQIAPFSDVQKQSTNNIDFATVSSVTTNNRVEEKEQSISFVLEKGRLVFQDVNSYSNALMALTQKDRNPVFLEKLAKTNFKSLLEDEKEKPKNSTRNIVVDENMQDIGIPHILKQILNNDGEVQVGDTINVVYNNYIYFFGSSEAEKIKELKKGGQNFNNRRVAIEKKVVGEKVISSGRVEVSNPDAKYQKEYSSCVGDVMKIVFEVYAYTFAGGSAGLRSSAVETRIKHEYKAGTYSWQPATLETMLKRITNLTGTISPNISFSPVNINEPFREATGGTDLVIPIATYGNYNAYASYQRPCWVLNMTGNYYAQVTSPSCNSAGFYNVNPATWTWSASDPVCF